LRRLILALVLAAAACGQTPQGYSGLEEVAFKQSCESAARNAVGPNMPQQTIVNYCGCVWGRITAEMPHEEFAAFSQLPDAERASSPTGRRLQAFAVSCRDTSAAKP